MTPTSRLSLLTCLLVYASSAHAIMVKFGTKEGPIVPPTPEPSVPPPKHIRNPAPVWEERSDDTPDPNAHWRPQHFIPQPMYTHVVYADEKQAPQNNAQRFVNSYIPKNREPIAAPPITNYFTPSQVVSQLSSQRLPGFGLRYFVPLFVNEQKHKNDKRQEDAKLNQIETNEIDVNGSDDAQWKFEKEAAKRTIKRHTAEGIFTAPAPRQYVYQFPVYVPRHH